MMVEMRLMEQPVLIVTEREGVRAVAMVCIMVGYGQSLGVWRRNLNGEDGWWRRQLNSGHGVWMLDGARAVEEAARMVDQGSWLDGRYGVLEALIGWLEGRYEVLEALIGWLDGRYGVLEALIGLLTYRHTCRHMSTFPRRYLRRDHIRLAPLCKR